MSQSTSAPLDRLMLPDSIPSSAPPVSLRWNETAYRLGAAATLTTVLEFDADFLEDALEGLAVEGIPLPTTLELSETDRLYYLCGGVDAREHLRSISLEFTAPAVAAIRSVLQLA